MCCKSVKYGLLVVPTTVSAQIEEFCSNITERFFGAVALKFEPKMTVIIKNLAQKVDFWAKCCSNQDCCSICADTVCDFKHHLLLFISDNTVLYIHM